MTSKEMMRKIGLRTDKFTDEKDNGDLKHQILEHLKTGKNKILLLERKIAGEKNIKKIMDQMVLSKEKLQMAKLNFDIFEKKAEQYIEKNPKKAVAMAVAAGVLAGSLWTTFKQKKTAPKKRTSVPANPLKNARAQGKPRKP